MPSLQEALAEFELAGQADGLSEQTIKWYSSLISNFVEVHPQVEVRDITAHDCRLYISGLRGRRTLYKDAPQRRELEVGYYTTNTVNGHITALKRFFHWISDEYTCPNPMVRVGKRAKTKPEARAISQVDFTKLFDTSKNIRDKAILAVFADTGARLGGVLSMTIPNTNLETRQALIIEKGKKPHTVFFTTFTARLISMWLLERGDLPNQALWTNLIVGTPFTHSGIHEMLKRLKQRAHIQGRVNPHSFRHNFARQYIQAGGDISTLARLLGHADIQTTHQYYAVFSPDELQEMHDKHIQLDLKGFDEA